MKNPKMIRWILGAILTIAGLLLMLFAALIAIAYLTGMNEGFAFWFLEFIGQEAASESFLLIVAGTGAAFAGVWAFYYGQKLSQ